MKKTQRERVLEYMKANGGITTRQAYDELGVTRLPSRIHELRKIYNINGEFIPVKNRFGETVNVKRYTLEDDNG